MRLFTRLEEILPRHFRRPIASIGVFDGVHRGHHAIIQEVAKLSRELSGEGVILTFHEHPDKVLKGVAPPSIHSLPHRLLLLQRAGVNNTVVINFDSTLSQISAEEFLRDTLHGILGIVGLVMGPDNRYGRGGEGDIALARKVGADCGFEVREARAVVLRGETVSSSAIREAIQEGDLDHAAEMLGKPVTFLGRVVKGDGRGGRIGFPTANLDLTGELQPPNGVYLATTTIQRKVYRSMVNIGVRPTFDGRVKTVEVHLLNFDGDIYGLSIEVIIHRRLRDEMKFQKVEDLVAQLRRDRDAAISGFAAPAGS